MDGSMTARRPARISLVEMGRCPGRTSSPTTPPSTTIVRWGAWVDFARTDGRRGVPTPAKTILWSASSRLAVAAMSSAGVQVMLARELPRGLLLTDEATGTETFQVRVERLRAVYVFLQICADGRCAI